MEAEKLISSESSMVELANITLAGNSAEFLVSERSTLSLNNVSMTTTNSSRLLRDSGSKVDVSFSDFIYISSKKYFSIFSFDTSKVKIDNILFAHNENVGSIYMDGGAKVIMSESRFYSNKISKERIGLLQLWERSVLHASSCTFDSNYFLKSSTLLHVSNSAKSFISDSMFSNNTAAQGGGVGTNRGSLNFINCTLKNNSHTKWRSSKVRTR